MSSDTVSPFKLLWQYNYPFAYWDNRLEKINPHNLQDRLEALYCLVQLTDLYSHIFAAKIQNPEMPWFFVAEETYRGDIDNVLEKLRKSDIATVGTLAEGPEGLVNVEANEEYDVDNLDAIAAGFLGCPHTVDEESKTVEFDEPPELHRGVCNAILDYAENQTALLNDFKHGFRVLPVSPDDINQIVEATMVFDEDEQEQLQETLDDLRETLESDEWGFSFVRLSTESTDYGYDCQLDVYHVDAWSCYKFAELTLGALYNLIAPPPGITLEDSLEEIPELILEGEVSVMDHVFGMGLPLRDDPEVVVSKEEFRS